MIQTINKTQFIDSFKSWHTYANNFSYEALELLFDHFEEYEIGATEPIELDVVAICCEYQESTIRECIDNYNIDVLECEDDDAVEEYVANYMTENTLFIGMTEQNTFVFQSF